jgi:hypothetical protein
MKRVLRILVAALVLATMLILAAPVSAGGGFDEFGYNYQARVFVGTGESWAMGKLGYSHELAEAYMGAYAHDQIVMKWNAEWDRGNDEGWSNGPYAAWTTNEWNGKAGREWDGGKVAGSGEVWHYKIIWVGPELADSLYWRDGGYAIWGEFEVVMDQGTSGEGHIWFTLAKPNGLGGIVK